MCGNADYDSENILIAATTVGSGQVYVSRDSGSTVAAIGASKTWGAIGCPASIGIVVIDTAGTPWRSIFNNNVWSWAEFDISGASAGGFLDVAVGNSDNEYMYISHTSGLYEGSWVSTSDW